MITTGRTKSSRRIAFVGALFALFFGAICLRAVDLQIFQKSFLHTKAKKQVLSSYESRPKRGIIYDSRYRELGVSLDSVSVAARPLGVKDKKDASLILANHLDMDSKFILDRLSGQRKFVWIKRQASPGQANEIREESISGIEFTREASRFYPNRELAAHVLGFCGVDGYGLEGLEYSFDNVLAGRGSRWTVLKDALGRGFCTERQTYSKKNGDNLVLTIDRAVQYITEQALASAVKDTEAVSGIAIVMVPDTGAILAMANVPLFDPNHRRGNDPAVWRNRAVTDTFEPGSTMKIFMAAAAIESGTCDPGTIFFCENGDYSIGANIVNDSHPYAWLSLQQIVKYSSNIGAVKIGERVGRQTLYEILKNFGFAKKLGIECPGEAAGTLIPYEDWSPMDAGAIAFGQGISVSALQLANAVSAIANDGVLMKPRLVEAITDANDRLVKSFPAQLEKKAVSKQTARVIKRIMATVVTDGGTGGQAAIDGYTVCGKTGTAQKADGQGGYAKDSYVASFVGFVPMERPAIAVVVLLDEPSKGYYGGVVAAPVFKRIAQETLQYLNVVPEINASRLTAGVKHGGSA